ncbi:MAG: hypothetical protein U0800_02050 [Isosphaeraceae bacterium]
MSITFPCGDCGQKYQVPQDLAGKRMKCRKCGSVQQIPVPRPRASVASPASASDSPFLDTAPSAPPPKPRTNAPAFDPFARTDAPSRPAPRPAEPNPYADLYGLDEPGYKVAPQAAEPVEDVIPPIGRSGMRPGGGPGKKKSKANIDSKAALIAVASFGGLFLLLGLIGLFSIPAAWGLMILAGLTGMAMMMTGGIWILVNAFRESAMCGILYFIPIVNYVWPLYYLVTRWEVQKRPFLLQMAGMLVLFVFGGAGFAEIGRLGGFDEANRNLANAGNPPFGQPAVVQPPNFGGPNFGGPNPGLPPGFPAPPPMPTPPPTFPQATPPRAPQRELPKAPSFQPGGGSFSGGAQSKPEPAPNAPRFTPGGGFSGGGNATKGAGGGFGSGPSLWNVAVDPPAQPVDLSGVKDISIAIPADYDSRNVVFPTAPSPFVVVGRNNTDKESRELWDLTAKKAVARVRGRSDISKPFALSADGAYLAGIVLARNAVMVIDLKANKELGRFEFPQHNPDYIDFAGNDRLVLGFFFGNQIQVWNLKTGQQVANISLKRFEKEAAAVSPGGKYVAAVVEQSMHVYGTENGAELGAAPLPRGENNADVKGKGLAFSPDGKELVALCEAWNKWYITCWDVADGRVIAQHGPLDKDAIKQPIGYELQAIQWLPKQDGWLVFGEAIIEKESGKKVETLPYGDELKVAARKILNDERALAVVGKDGRRLVAMPLQTEKIAAAMKIAKSGGDPLDATLGGTRSADLASARQVNLANVAWSAVPDPAAAPAKGVSSRLTTLRTKPGEVVKILFSGPDVGRAAISSQPDKPFFQQQPALDGKALVIDRYDITNGKHLGRIELPPSIDLAAYSPDGKAVLTINYKDQDRLDAFDEAGKPIAGWRPYDKESGDDRKVTWADFLDANRVLTANTAGTVVLWTLPDCKPEYVIDRACQGTPRLSPGRKSLALFRDGAFTLVDPATGEARGTTGAVASPPNRTGVTASCFSKDGATLAAVVGANLTRWDLATGQAIGEFPIAVGEAKSVELCGPNHALVNGQALYDVNRRKIIWYYNGGVAASGSPDGLHWLVLGNPFNPALLGSLQMPEPKVEQLVAQSEDRSIQAVLRAGTPVSIQFEMGTPPRDGEAFRKKLAEALTNRLRAAGADPKDNQPVKLVARITEKPTGENMELQMMGMGLRNPGPRNLSIPIRNLECELLIADAQGPIPIAKQTMHMRQFGIVHLPAGEGDIPGYLFNQVWLGAQGWFGGIGLPSYVARGPSGIIQLPGNTDLNQLVK